MLTPREFIEETSTQSFSCKAAHFQAYQSGIIDGRLHIYGVGKSLGNKGTIFIDQRDKNDLLISLLQLYEHLDPTLYGHFDERVQDVDISRIIYWCNRYGLPMEASTLEEDSLWKKHGKVGFWVSDFYNRLHNLYTCYLLWLRIEYEDTEDDNFYSKTSIDECKAILQGHMLTLDIRLHPDFSQYPPTFHLDCENYMAVAYSQMFFQCMSHEAPYIGVCAVCAQPFAKRRKNNTLCPECQSTKSKRSRDKARAAARRSSEKERSPASEA